MTEPTHESAERFDVRLAVGAFFSPIGAMLALFGGLSGQPPSGKSLGFNVDLWWGLVLCAFGSLLLGLAWRARRRRTAMPSRRSRR